MKADVVPALLACLFLGAALAGMAATYAVRSISRALGIVSRPNAITDDKRPRVALLGGAAVGIGAVIALSLAGNSIPLPHREWRWLAGALLFLAFGVLDDLRPFSPGPKFVGQIAVGATALAIGDPSSIFGAPPLDFALHLLIVLVFVNAVNFTDVCDGLVAGISVVAFVGVALVRPEVAPVALAVAGASLGFLSLNKPPATIFMGDAGTHFIGFLLAELLLRGIGEETLVSDAVSTLLVVGIPLFETAFITAVRIRKGLPWWRGSPDHFSLRLQSRGWTRWRVGVFSWSIASILCLLALAADRGEGTVALWSLGLALVGGVFAWRYLLTEDKSKGLRTQTPSHESKEPEKDDKADMKPTA